MKKALFVIAVFVVGLGVVVGVLTTGAGGSSREDRFSLAEAREFDGWPLYDAGESVDGGIPRGEILRDPGTVTFIYGDCEPPVGDGGCSPPAQIQISPACIRHPALYEIGPGQESSSKRQPCAACPQLGSRRVAPGNPDRNLDGRHLRAESQDDSPDREEAQGREHRASGGRPPAVRHRRARLRVILSASSDHRCNRVRRPRIRHRTRRRRNPCRPYPVSVLLGVDQGWWGNGVGDGWQSGLAIWIALAVGATLGGARLRQRL